MSKHPRCSYSGPHAAHDFVTYVEPIDITRFGDDPAPVPYRPMLEQLWCNGERAAKWCRTHGQQWPRCVSVSGLHQIEDTP